MLTTTVTTPPALALPRREQARADRYRARSILWRESRRSRMQKCGKVTVSEAGVGVRASGAGAERRAGFAGVYTCGSVWSCPVCSEVIQTQRRTEISDALRIWRERGGSVAFITLTMRHHKGDGLGALWLALSKAWNRATSGSRGWKDDKAALGVGGYIRTVEVTHGENGWHVHVHSLVFLRGSEKAVKRAHLLGYGMFGRWARSLAREGFEPTTRRGVDIQVIQPDSDDEAARYFTKSVYRGESSAAFEVTGSHAKKGRAGSRTPFEVLSDVVRLGDVDDLALWHEWERVSAGKLQLVWSRGRKCDDHRDEDMPVEGCPACVVGLRQELGLVAEVLTDEEVMERQAELQGDTLKMLTPTEFNYLRKRGLLLEVLRHAERDDGGRALLGYLRPVLRPLYVERE